MIRKTAAGRMAARGEVFWAGPGRGKYRGLSTPPSAPVEMTGLERMAGVKKAARRKSA